MPAKTANQKKAKSVVSPGNDKIGDTPNVSMLPAATCAKDVPCRKLCYCVKALRTYPEVLKKWHYNTELWVSDPMAFKWDVAEYLAKNRPKYFRWFVAGDIPDETFLQFMIDIARDVPETRFLCFTKKYELFSEKLKRFSCWAVWPKLEIPRNLTIVISRWDQWKYQDVASSVRLYPQAHIVRKGTPVILTDRQFICPGKCEGCRKCWEMKAGDAVFFHEH